MFKALGKLFKTIGYALSGRINQISEIWGEDPHVVGEKYNQIINEKKARYQTITRAVSRLMTSLDKKKRQLQEYRAQAQEKEKVTQGAKIAGQRRSRELKSQGMDIEKIKVDEKIKEFAAKSADAGSSLVLLKNDIKNLESEIEGDSKELKNFEKDIKQMQRDFDNLSQERDRAMAKVTSASERKQLYEMKTGISNDETSELLREVRNSVSNVENITKLAAKTTGYENKQEEEDLIALAETGGNEGFFSEIGLVDEEKESLAEEKNTKTKEKDAQDSYQE
ncbi:MAG: hypothetical protein L6416_11690 [Candidatus Omnitrophica bacterium]|nr:hypothetical protein [Candidatus Omnitrophota bacterium]